MLLLLLLLFSSLLLLLSSLHLQNYFTWSSVDYIKSCKIQLTLKTPRKPASENVVCLCCLLNILANFSNLSLHRGKQCGPRSDCSYRSSLIWVHTVSKKLLLNHKQISRQMTIVVIGGLRVNKLHERAPIWATPCKDLSLGIFRQQRLRFRLCWGFTAQSTQWGHVECSQFT